MNLASGLCTSNFLSHLWSVVYSLLPTVRMCQSLRLIQDTYTDKKSEPVFLNVYGAQESIPRNEFRQPM
jgi:hypothetical protein